MNEKIENIINTLKAEAVKRFDTAHLTFNRIDQYEIAEFHVFDIYLRIKRSPGNDDVIHADVYLNSDGITGFWYRNKETDNLTYDMILDMMEADYNRMKQNYKEFCRNELEQALDVLE